MSWPEIKHKLAANIGRVALDLGECSFGKVWSVIWRHLSGANPRGYLPPDLLQR